MAGWNHLYWTCPFYRNDQKAKLHCEAGWISLRSPAALSDYAKKYCASHDWKNCTLAREILKTYETEENDDG
ncbi:MAG: hypothetical protein MJ074_10825 [Oscillospiraceae bacterium]|nr:hypothetical protein [Oscillospiraceae bacterium]